MPKVSVIIPTFNRPAYLRQALESIDAQTFSDFEVIVVQNGRAASCEEVLKPFLDQGMNVRYHYEKKGDPTEARNIGVRLAKGEYVAFLDDDDVWSPEKLALQAAELDANPELGFVSCHADMVNERDEITGEAPAFPFADTIEELISHGTTIYTMTLVMARKELVTRAGMLNPKYAIGSDYDLYLRMAVLSGFKTIRKKLARYRIHGKNLSRNQPTREQIDILRLFMRKHPEYSYMKEKADAYVTILVNELYRTASDLHGDGELLRALGYYFHAVKYDPAVGGRMRWGKLKHPSICLIKPYINIAVLALIAGLPAVLKKTAARLLPYRLKKAVSGLMPRKYRNIEGYRKYHFDRPAFRLKKGVTAMIRAKNEEENVRRCLESIYDYFDEIVFVDNGSTDRTREEVRAFVMNHDSKNKVHLYHYPFPIARCGEEHDATDENSVRSLVYYYNWTLSKCSFSHVFKWDADMVLNPETSDAFRAEIRRLAGEDSKFIEFKIQTVYRRTDGSYLKSVGEVNHEVRMFRNEGSVYFAKAKDWEVISSDTRMKFEKLDPVFAFEIKSMEVDEFAHWTTREFTTERKMREWEKFNKVISGKVTEDEFQTVPSSKIHSSEQWKYALETE